MTRPFQSPLLKHTSALAAVLAIGTAGCDSETPAADTSISDVSSADTSADTSAPDTSASDVAPTPDVVEAARPAITITAPATGSVLAALDTTLTVAVTGAPATSLELALNAAPATTVGTDIAADTAVEIPVALRIGVNTLIVRALDADGIASEDDLVLVVTPGPSPLVDITSHTDGATVYTPAVRLTGVAATTRTLASIEASVGGAAPVAAVLGEAVDNTIAYTLDLDLADGANTIVVTATDDLGQTGTRTVVVTRSADATAPTVALTFPRDGASVPLRAVELTGFALDAEGAVTVTLEDPSDDAILASATPEADGAFRLALDLVPGDNAYRIVVTDAAGNETTLARSVYFGQRLGAGGAHGGVIDDGQLYAWGRNNKGQVGLGYLSVLGDVAPPHPNAATHVAFAGTPLSLAFAQNASVVLDTAGQLWGFGDNANGQLCLGTAATDDAADTADRLAPALAPAVANAVAVHRGYSHTLVLFADGTVGGCGKNASGQLGDASGSPSDVPAPIAGLANIVQISAGSETSYAVDADGLVWAWGRNQYGNLGQGTSDTTIHATPTAVPGLTDVVRIANGRDHVLALRRDGSVWAWGLNASNQVGPDGVGGFEGPVLSPIQVAGITGAVAVHASGNQGFYEDTEGRLWGWGQNGNGNLGMPLDEDQTAPTIPVFGVDSVVDVVIGPLHGFARTALGTLFGWGWSFQGSLGGGNAAISTWSYRVPVLVQFAE